MDTSPLAAMHPSPAPTWGHNPHSHFGLGGGFRSGTFNIRDQLQRTKPDYFNLKGVRGSSPTVSLAADLSQNFRIDNESSPRFPTPRRALFTSNIMGDMDDQESFVTTPPLPVSSSPFPDSEMMDLSPLPHKGPFAPSNVEVSSPTPTITPSSDDVMIESPIIMRKASSNESLKASDCGRKRMALRRPSLSRNKGHSTGALLQHKLHPETQVTSFRFGNTSAFGSATSTPALSPGDCFSAESPPQERRPSSAESPCHDSPISFRPRPSFAGLTSTRDARSGSPLMGRRPSNPFSRPGRRQYRRSLSMFESPGDVVKSKGDCPPSTLQSVMDVEESCEPSLPHFFPEGENDNIPRVSRDTFLNLMDGKFSDKYDQKIVIDCRFEYEYEGGHINGAINYNDKELLTRHLFQTPMAGRTLLIFHCEYSAHRAPMMARHIRAEDRTANAEFYPKLTYPEVYILDGGYSEFYNTHRDRCYPQAYIEMNAEEHAFTCERELGKLKQRKGLNRAKTFAFGARENMVHASPTAPPRLPRHHESPCAMIGNSPILGSNRSPARRMASY